MGYCELGAGVGGGERGAVGYGWVGGWVGGSLSLPSKHREWNDETPQ